MTQRRSNPFSRGVRAAGLLFALSLGAAGVAGAQTAHDAKLGEGAGVTPSAWFALDSEGGRYGSIGLGIVRGNVEYRAALLAGVSRPVEGPLADDFTGAIAGAFFGPDAADIDDGANGFAGVSVSAARLFFRGRSFEPYAGVAAVATTHREVAPGLLFGGRLRLSPDAALRVEYRRTWGILPAVIVGASFRF